jgi:hypothetical protein
MNAPNVISGILCGALAFGVLSWSTAKQTRAAVLSTPPAGRFELVQLHESAASEWSAVLDTETGCTWTYTSNTPPDSPKTTFEFYNVLRGTHFFENVAYETTGYVLPVVPSGGQPDYSKPIAEISRIDALCNRVRVQALEMAGAR